MLSLRDAQCAFIAAVRSDEAGLLASLVVNNGIESGRRIQIYRNNHRLGALATMHATYPIIERLGGSDWFRQSAARYQLQYPSHSGDLQYLGQHYPEFLRSDLVDTPFAYFSDVAALEWAYQLVLTAEERAPVTLDVLHAVDAEDYDQLLFVPRPALQIVESQFPIFAIWHANQPGAQSDSEIRLDAGASRVLLIRRSDHVELREMSQGTCRLLEQFRLQAPLGAAAASVAAESEEFDLQFCLRELLGLEAIAEITVGER